MVTRPRFCAASSRELETAPSSSASTFSATGWNSRPASVSWTRRVVRSNSRNPKTPSSSLISTLTADCVRCRRLAAAVKLPTLRDSEKRAHLLQGDIHRISFISRAQIMKL